MWWDPGVIFKASYFSTSSLYCTSVRQTNIQLNPKTCINRVERMYEGTYMKLSQAENCLVLPSLLKIPDGGRLSDLHTAAISGHINTHSHSARIRSLHQFHAHQLSCTPLHSDLRKHRCQWNENIDSPNKNLVPLVPLEKCSPPALSCHG